MLKDLCKECNKYLATHSGFCGRCAGDEIEKCKNSPHYFATKYLAIKSSLPENEFNRQFKELENGSYIIGSRRPRGRTDRILWMYSILEQNKVVLVAGCNEKTAIEYQKLFEESGMNVKFEPNYVTENSTPIYNSWGELISYKEHPKKLTGYKFERV